MFACNDRHLLGITYKVLPSIEYPALTYRNLKALRTADCRLPLAHLAIARRSESTVH